MKAVKNPFVGQLVQIPAFEFAPMRSGWNGWIFRVGVIEKLYISKSGRKCAKVRYCTKTAGRYQLLPCTEYSKGLILIIKISKTKCQSPKMTPQQRHRQRLAV